MTQTTKFDVPHLLHLVALAAVIAGGAACGNGGTDVTDEYDTCPPASTATPAAVVRVDDLPHRPLPAWYGDAKFGIMIHWGVWTIPAFGDRTVDTEAAFSDPDHPDFLFAPGGIERFLKHMPYSEWYWNSISIDDSPARAHHLATYGEDFAYEEFVPSFENASATFDAAQWADLFQRAGARYVVLVTKHHDGWALWPSAVPHPFRDGWYSRRDFVGELNDAVTRRCLRMGLYYSGGIDWTFGSIPIRGPVDFVTATPNDPAYAAYADAQFRELIERYRPSILWNDINYPPAADPLQLFAEYYTAVADGVVNDRFTGAPGSIHHDFFTPEFRVLEEIETRKWETVRGMGRGFGFNSLEVAADFGPPEKFIHMLIDVVSKNGNLLLNVGPRADGSIPAEQVAILESMGAWLDVHGEAIFATRPWQRFGGDTDAGPEVRYTWNESTRTVYAILLGDLEQTTLRLADFDQHPTSARLLGTDGAVEAIGDTGGLRLTMPSPPPSRHAHVFALTLE